MKTTKFGLRNVLIENKLQTIALNVKIKMMT